MNTKVAIASLALLASANSAFALIGPGRGPRPEVRNYCLSLYQDEDGQASVGDCDQSAANRLRRVPLLHFSRTAVRKARRPCAPRAS
jgi:hypothetical protein